MTTERKEPVISPEAYDLTDRVKLTWREIRELAETSQPEEPTEPHLAAVVPPPEETPPPVTRKLDEDEMKAIAAMIAPALEESIKASLRDILEVSIQNASTRIRGDLDRSVTGVVNETIRRELAKIDLKLE